MRKVNFTQYLRPDGRQMQVSIELEDQYADKADRILALGHRFECEVLMNGLVSFTVTGKMGTGPNSEEGDLAMQLVPNGPKVPDAVRKLIMDFPLEDN